MPYEPILLRMGVVFATLLVREKLRTIQFDPACFILEDEVFLLTVGCLLLTVELPCLQLSFLAFYLQLELFCLQLELFCLQWKGLSGKHLNGL